MSDQKTTFQIFPIGIVRRQGADITIEINEEYRPALLGLGHFSHVMVFWWASLLDTLEYRSELQCRPPYAQDHQTGMFATRSPVRPNPILMTTCKLLEVDEKNGVVKIADLDCFEGTPVVDLKAYFPVCDRVRQVHIPEWLSDWPEWMPDNGIGLEEYELEVGML